jgi:hypothetical protein
MKENNLLGQVLVSQDWDGTMWVIQKAEILNLTLASLTSSYLFFSNGFTQHEIDLIFKKNPAKSICNKSEKDNKLTEAVVIMQHQYFRSVFLDNGLDTWADERIKFVCQSK